jgi:hypothetical protein
VSRAQLVVGAPVALAVSRWRFSRLRRANPHPFGLSGAPAPMMLSSDGWGPGLTDVVLSYGRLLAVAGQLIEVATCFSERHCYLPSLEEAIGRAEHRDAAWTRGDWESAGGPFEPVPEVPLSLGAFEHEERSVVVEGQERAIAVVSRRNYEALRFRQGPAVVTAVARSGFPGVPSFQVVDDLEPYFAGYTRFVLSWLRFWQT